MTRTVLYTTEEDGEPITREMGADGGAPPLTMIRDGMLYQLSLVVHHSTPAGGFTDV